MKRVLGLLTGLLLIAVLLVGCKAKDEDSKAKTTASETVTNAAAKVTTPAAEVTTPLEGTPTKEVKTEISAPKLGETITAQEVVPDRITQTDNDLANGGSFAAPVFSVASGMYTEEFELSLTAEEGTIFYTTDGSNPLTSATRKTYKEEISIIDRSSELNLYSAINPAELNQFYKEEDLRAPEELVDKCFVVRAVAVTEDNERSNIATATYFVGDTARDFLDNEVAVLSVTTDPANLFDYDSGIYVNGASLDQFKKDNPREEWMYWGTANYRQKGSAWEREAHIDFFETDGTYTYSQDCGIRIQGGYSRGDIQKSLRFLAKNTYQPEGNNFNYAFFDNSFDEKGEILDKYKTLVCRSGANDAFYIKFTDNVLQSFVWDRAVSTQKGRPCIVMLDGEYWGLYVLQEDYSNDYFEDHYGVIKDDIAMIKATDDYKAELEEGEEADLTYYNEMIDWFQTADLTDATQYQKACEYIDEQSIADYCAFQIYICNEDWPGKNWAFWRAKTVDETNPYADGRFRLCIYDTEMGANHYGNRSTHYNADRVKAVLKMYDKDSRDVKLLFYKYMQSETFQTKFYQALKDYATVNFASDTALTTIEEAGKVYLPEMDRFFERYLTWADHDSAAAPCYERLYEFIEKRDDYILKQVEKQ